MPGQIKIASNNTKLLERKQRFAYLLLPHKLPHSLRLETMVLFSSNFTKIGKGLLSSLSLMNGMSVGVTETGDLFPRHLVSWLTSLAPPCFLSLSSGSRNSKACSWDSGFSSLVFLVQSHLHMPAGFQPTGAEVLRPLIALPGLEPRHSVISVKAVRGSTRFQEEMPETGLKSRLENRG